MAEVRVERSERRLLVLHDSGVSVESILAAVFDRFRTVEPFPQVELRTRYFTVVIDCWIESFDVASALTLAEQYASEEASEVMAATGGVLVIGRDREQVLPLLERLQPAMPDDAAAVACYVDLETGASTAAEPMDDLEHGFLLRRSTDGLEIRRAIEVGPWASTEQPSLDLEAAAARLTALRGEILLPTLNSTDA